MHAIFSFLSALDKLQVKVPTPQRSTTEFAAISTDSPEIGKKAASQYSSRVAKS